MKNKKLLLAALLVGIPSTATLIKSNQTQAMLRATTNAVKNISSSTKTIVNKQSLPPTTSSRIKVSRSTVSSKVSIFNTQNTKNNLTAQKSAPSVGKLNINSSLTKKLDSILSNQANPNSTSTSGSKTSTVGKLNSSSSNKLGTLLGGSTQKSQSLDLSKLPSTPPPPPPSPTTGTPTTSTTQTSSSLNTSVSTSTPTAIPDAPPLTSALTNKLTSTSSISISKNKLTSKNSGGKTTQVSKTPTPQDALITELKSRLKPKS